ncbi:MAG: hypothetical protein BWY41_00107 [Candidatus Atribacteria bacterium ADurb.Bin276]|uniref:Uncharacterized protein n=1 Tax=Candidatus Atribacter allofermentans TaxID=1852833 RepID=A0A1V5T3V3_9BACT|nr:MAG: hypothetical protein BWY41_00107 [Candidatus Atribacteria bacterium ADurb.Bin276]
MFIKLKDGSHINATKIMSIHSDQNDYRIRMLSGEDILLDASQFQWVCKICGFLIQLKNGVIINTLAIVAIQPRNRILVLTLDNGSTFDLVDEEAFALMGECQCMNLEQRILFLQGKNVPCDDYKKL